MSLVVNSEKAFDLRKKAKSYLIKLLALSKIKDFLFVPRFSTSTSGFLLKMGKVNTFCLKKESFFIVDAFHTKAIIVYTAD